MKKFGELIFPALLFSTFTIFPLFFSFDDSSNNELSEHLNNSFKKDDKTLLVKKSSWKPFFFFDSKDEDNEKESVEIVPYNRSQISIFSHAINSLMDYYFPVSFEQL